MSTVSINHPAFEHTATLVSDAPPSPPPRSPKRKPWNPDLPPDSPSPPASPTTRYERLPIPAEKQFPWGLQPIQEADEDGETHPALIQNASPAPRGKSLSMRVAQSSQQIRAWVEELEDWKWDGTFEASTSSEKTRDQHGTTSPAEFSWRRIPIGQTIAYHTRVEAISRDLLELDMEEQKYLVLQNYLLPPCLLDSKKHTTGILSMSQLQDLDDLTALLTLTLIQALPYYTKLRSLLAQWKTRLAVLSQIPGFLADLQDANKALNDARHTIGLHPCTFPQPQRATIVHPDHLPALRVNCEQLRSRMQRSIATLWAKLDTMLDFLENSEGSLPYKLVTVVVNYERSFSEWSVEAEKRLLASSMRAQEMEHDARGTDGRLMLAEAAAAATIVISYRRPKESPRIVGGNWGREPMPQPRQQQRKQEKTVQPQKNIQKTTPGIQSKSNTLRRESRSVHERPGFSRRDSGYASNESDTDSMKDAEAEAEAVI